MEKLRINENKSLTYRKSWLDAHNVQEHESHQVSDHGEIREITDIGKEVFKPTLPRMKLHNDLWEAMQRFYCSNKDELTDEKKEIP